MQIPLQIAFHNVDHSDAVEARIREKMAKLEQIHSRITSCRVVVEATRRVATNNKALQFSVHLDITLPGGEIVVRREPTDAKEDIYVALREAFQAAQRQLREFVDRQRGDVKNHEAIQAEA